MFPNQLKDIFGIKGEEDLKTANSIWKMLDDMADNSPQNYRQFIEKNIKQGVSSIKQKQDQINKPYLITPTPAILLSMQATLKEKMLNQIDKDSNECTNKINQLDLTHPQWQAIYNKFSKEIKINLNICHSPYIMAPTTIAGSQRIQNFYYSLQGPTIHNQTYSYIIIINSEFYSNQPNRKTTLPIILSHFQYRLQTDKNPLLKSVDPKKFNRTAYYALQINSIVVEAQGSFNYANNTKPTQYLIEKEVDIRRKEQCKKIVQAKMDPLKNQSELHIRFKEHQSQKEASEALPTLIPTSSKKPLIEQIDDSHSQPTYKKTETTDGYIIQYHLPSINSMKQLDLQASVKSVRLKIKDQIIEVALEQMIDTNKIGAKFKKKNHQLKVQLKRI